MQSIQVLIGYSIILKNSLHLYCVYRDFFHIYIMLQSQNSGDFAAVPLIIVLIIFFAAYQAYRKSSFRRRMEAVRSRPVLNIPPHKVIIALDLVGLFVQISEYKRENFQKLKVQTKGVAHVLLKVKEFLGIGLYFRPKMLKKTIRTLLQSLADNPKIQLFLYTSLPLPAADEILTKLCLNHFFPNEFRRSCSQDYCQRLKHPTQVNQNTKRVIILTNAATDHLQQDPKYFLEVQESKVAQSIKILSSLISENKQIQELHNELAQAKAELEYDV